MKLAIRMVSWGSLTNHARVPHCIARDPRRAAARYRGPPGRSPGPSQTQGRFITRLPRANDQDASAPRLRLVASNAGVAQLAQAGPLKVIFVFQAVAEEAVDALARRAVSSPRSFVSGADGA